MHFSKIMSLLPFIPFPLHYHPCSLYHSTTDLIACIFKLDKVTRELEDSKEEIEASQEVIAKLKRDNEKV